MRLGKMNDAERAASLAELGLAGPMTSYQPTVTPQNGAINSLGTVSGRYQMLNTKLCFVSVDISITDNGNGSGFISCTLPRSSTAANFVGFGRENAAVGSMLQAVLPPSADTMRLFKYDNTYPGGNGYRLLASILYEIA